MSGPPPDIRQHSDQDGDQRDRERLAELTGRIAELRTHLQEQTKAVRTARNRLRRRQFSIGYLQGLLWLRSKLRIEYQLAILLVAFFGSGAASFAIGAMLGLPVLGFIGLWIGLTIFAFAVYAHVLAFPVTEFVEATLTAKRQTIEQLRQEQQQAEAAVADTIAALQPLEAEAEKLKSKRADNALKLKEIDWRALRGMYFERFLRQVFEHLGYEVQITKTAGDQGVDLIVTLGERRIAIQAKGFAEKVDVFAVQEAYAGMAFYHCQGCAVITNATFTEAARALAKSVNCILIDGTQIPSLIDGNITL